MAALEAAGSSPAMTKWKWAAMMVVDRVNSPL